MVNIHFFIKKMYNKFMENKIKNIHWFPGHMKKASNRIEEQVKLVDFVIVLLDSRIPISSKNNLLEKITQNKRKLYILTKPDLSDDKETLKWVNKLSENGNFAIALNLKESKSKSILLKAFEQFNLEKKEKMLKKGIKNFTTKAMVIGIPNVGKSTLINMFANKHITKTGNSAGVTKNLRWVKIDNFELLDVPGILEPSYDDKEKAINLALIGSMKESILPTYDLCNFCLDFLKNNYRQALIDRYELNDLDLNDNSQILDFISIKRGFLLKDGKPDISKTELVLLNEFKNGLITKYTLERI